MATVSVRDLVKLYEGLITASAVSMHYLDVDESAPGEPHGGVLTAVDSPMSDFDSAETVVEFGNKTIHPEPQSVGNYGFLQTNSVCFEPHLGFLRAIDTPSRDYDAANMMMESANKTFQAEPQSVGNSRRLHNTNSGCFKLVLRKLAHLFRLYKQPSRIH